MNNKDSKNTMFNLSDKSLDITTIIHIDLVDGLLDVPTVSNMGAMLDIIGSYSSLLIATLTRRMDACMDQLLKYRKSVVHNDGDMIIYKRNDGTYHSFNVPSFVAMQNAVKALQFSEFRAFAENRFWIDQTLKALLNDPEVKHEDCGGFKYSDLVSCLCEIHIRYDE